MSQHDYVLDDAAGAPFRADVNSALGAIATQNSGATAPVTTYAGMPWFDTTTGLQKYRNAANTAWVLDSLSAASRGSVAMHSTTMDLWALPQISDGTGSPVTITAIANAPHPSARRTLYPIAGTVITNGATFAVDGAANYTTASGDALEFEAVTTSTYKVHITKKDGSSVAGAEVPTGAVAYFAMSTAPTGWLKANGALVSRATYAALFAAIGTTYGAGDGSTTFAVPDLRGEFMRGLDDGRGVDAGRAIGSAQAEELKSHTHQIYSGVSGGVSTPQGFGKFQYDATTNPTASTGGTETRPRNIAMLVCIKF